MYLSHLDEAGLLTRSTFRSRLEDFGAATRRDSTAKAVLTGSQELSALSSRESTKDRLAREGAERRKGSKEPAGSKEKAGPREPSGSMEQTGSKERARLKKARPGPKGSKD
ncbi:unnamed protein product [Prorocentrum cordatum]|uniref:Uncharacterized protein n=1 Tax=Prorocentrum cordatum TaxID=2364126 RepID=A0ABN9PXL8_9DINO|nr:unnamed protein product [Polarella glacialis]